MIEVRNLEFSYEKKPLFKNFNLKVKKNETLMITGVNGVGKSTLLKLLAGVLNPHKGSIIYEGIPVSYSKSRIGFISDSISMYEDLKVEELIKLHCDVYGVKNFYTALMEHAKIDLKTKFASLSLGQKIIVKLSLILSHQPKYLLIDEVIPNMDAYLRELFLNELIKTIVEKDVTIVFVNLNFYDIENIVDRTIVLSDGRIVLDEATEKLKQKVKKVVTSQRIDDLPVIFKQSYGDTTEYFLYPWNDEFEMEIHGEIYNLNLTEIIKAFIGGEYVQ